jgi:hypothetical protein
VGLTGLFQDAIKWHSSFIDDYSAALFRRRYFVASDSRIIEELQDILNESVVL